MANKIDEFLIEVLQKNGSDLHFLAVDPPRLRLHGELQPGDRQEPTDPSRQEGRDGCGVHAQPGPLAERVWASQGRDGCIGGPVRSH